MVTERRRSLSQTLAPLFGFRSEPKTVKPVKAAKPVKPVKNDKNDKLDTSPRLRRKLQKLGKHASDSSADTAANERPLTLFNDGTFVSIKYETRRPASAVRPSTGHETLLNRHSIAITPMSSPPLPTAEDLRLAADRQVQAERQARAMAMVDAQERAQALSRPQTPARTAAQTPRPAYRDKPMPPPPLLVPQSVPRHQPQFHYRPQHPQHAHHASTASSSSFCSSSGSSTCPPVSFPRGDGRTPYGHQPYSPARRNESVQSVQSFARHSMAASIVSSPSSVTTSTMSFSSSGGLSLTPPRSSASSITPPGSFCSSDRFHVLDPCSGHGRGHGRGSGRGSVSGSVASQDSPRVVPELSRLASQTDCSAVLDSTVSLDSSQTRRKPKTPVYAIGQLEDGQEQKEQEERKEQKEQKEQAQKQKQHAPHNRFAFDITPPSSPRLVTATQPTELSLLQSKSSIECIAEQYRALLASRNSMFTDAHSVLDSDDEDKSKQNKAVATPPTTPPQRRFLLSAQPAQSAQSAQPVQPVQSPRKTHKSRSESVSTFSPLPSPVFSRGRAGSPDTLATVNTVSSLDNPSLQICMDLLSRELSSAVVGRQSALQVLVMIEAYERLRDRLAKEARRKKDGSHEQVEAMFSLWLRALYGIHDQLTSPAPTRQPDEDPSSDSEYNSAEE